MAYYGELAEMLTSRIGGQTSRHPTLTRVCFHTLPHVVSARVGDSVVLMDRKQGSYFKLNEVGGRVWDLVGNGRTASEVCEQLLEEYDVPAHRLEEDVVSTLHKFLGDRLISPGAARVTMPAGQVRARDVRANTCNGGFRVPSVLRCVLMILVVKAMLKVCGSGWTIEWVRRRVQEVRFQVDLDLPIVKETEYQVAMAGALYPGRAKCLEQSMVLYFVLRRGGVPVKFRLGVQPFPFLAHAWVEYRGELINDVLEHTKWFACLPDLLP